MEVALILLVVAGAVLIVTGPLRGRSRVHDETLEAERDRTRRAEAVELLKRLEAAQERAEPLP